MATLLLFLLVLSTADSLLDLGNFDRYARCLGFSTAIAVLAKSKKISLAKVACLHARALASVVNLEQWRSLLRGMGAALVIRNSELLTDKSTLV